jgi:hypothetical protein
VQAEVPNAQLSPARQSWLEEQVAARSSGASQTLGQLALTSQCASPAHCSSEVQAPPIATVPSIAAKHDAN